ncbi:aldehyde dehydrogenase family protein [Streptomyces sp. NPDC048636]|uniref:aldehyde dehydrogenase family protein n=1 Tax=Streptomyces sp. NPDC048636 TaxID=3155762 RepID=UPI0034341292
MTTHPTPSATAFTSIDAAAIVTRLRTAFRAGHTRPLAWRREQLTRLRTLLTENGDAIAGALHHDLRKSRTEVDTMEIGGTLREIDHCLEHLDAWLAPESAAVPAFLPEGTTARTEWEPLGVALVISAWNYPVNLLLVPVAGALAAGNAVVIKPADYAVATSALLADLLPRYLDNDATAVVEGGPEETALLLAQRFDHIFYTGNGTVGRIVMTTAATHLTPVTLELGGKSPVFVDRDVDLSLVAERVTQAKFTNAGQTCVAPDYLLTDPYTADALEAALAVAVYKRFGADPQRSDAYGRIINERHFDRIAALLGSGRTVTGGQADRADKYIAPTVLADVKADEPVMCEEIFGPVLPILTVADLDEAIAFINDRDKPLALYAFTEDNTTRRRLASTTSSGALNFGLPMSHLSVSSLPFGGVGESGMGSYRGRYSLETFSHRKAILDVPLS